MKLYLTLVLVFSISILFLFVGEGVWPLCVFGAVAVVAAKLSEKSAGWARGAIVLAVGVFIVAKVMPSSSLALPLGFSVLAFSAISLLYDVQRNHERYSCMEMAAYLFFVPKIFAGPISRPKETILQLRNPRMLSLPTAYDVMKLLIFATFCKFVVADNLEALLSPQVCTEPQESSRGVNAWAECVIYAVSFYFDFYAYSLYAIAAAKLLGIDLPASFDRPYFCGTFQDFWRRWNITLGTWLRDYVYIPLGGSRKGKRLTTMNVVIVFLVSGLWHGASAPFVLWGLLHGLLLVVEKSVTHRPALLYRVWVIVWIVLLWQLFRFENLSQIMSLVDKLFAWEAPNASIIAWAVGSITVLIALDNSTTIRLLNNHESTKHHIMAEAALMAVMLTCVLLFSDSSNINFFYTRF